MALAFTLKSGAASFGVTEQSRLPCARLLHLRAGLLLASQCFVATLVIEAVVVCRAAAEICLGPGRVAELREGPWYVSANVPMIRSRWTERTGPGTLVVVLGSSFEGRWWGS
ncbi:hypothetical protein RhiLY_13204 [Ceratobasidium sp. AG-Ba]|nr:hypothetical protein RhiLY_13204 [Ceratobasidium sp. AG-Ba]